MNETSRKPGPLEGAGPIGRAPTPRRFYKEASYGPHDAGFILLLDNRTGKTPAGNPLAVPSEALARRLADEWAGQGERLDPLSMPLTRLVNSAIDGVSSKVASVRADIVRRAGSDLLCYRADEPASLIAEEEAAWSPLLDYIREAIGAHFVVAEGVMHVAQKAETFAAVDGALEGYDHLGLSAIHTVTTLTGSVVIALAVARGAVTPEAAWQAAHVDEDWQMSRWGSDEPALQTRALHWREMEAAGFVLSVIRK